jgi:hypothetical protein
LVPPCLQGRLPPPPQRALGPLSGPPIRLRAIPPVLPVTFGVARPCQPGSFPVGSDRPGPCNAGFRRTLLAPVLPFIATLMQPLHDVTSSRPVVHPSRAGQLKRTRDEERGKSDERLERDDVGEDRAVWTGLSLVRARGAAASAGGGVSLVATDLPSLYRTHEGADSSRGSTTPPRDGTAALQPSTYARAAVRALGSGRMRRLAKTVVAA